MVHFENAKIFKTNNLDCNKLFDPGLGVTGFAVSCVTKEPVLNRCVDYASFLRVYATMRNRPCLRF